MPEADRPTGASPTRPHAASARQLADVQESIRAGQFEPAARAAQRFLVENPSHAEALYCLAVCRRYLGDPNGATAALDQLLASNPRYARAWQERGHLAKARGDLQAAVSAYQRAVRLNSALAASWRNLFRLPEPFFVHQAADAQ